MGNLANEVEFLYLDTKQWYATLQFFENARPGKSGRGGGPRPARARSLRYVSEGELEAGGRRRPGGLWLSEDRTAEKQPQLGHFAPRYTPNRF